MIIRVIIEGWLLDQLAVHPVTTLLNARHTATDQADNDSSTDNDSGMSDDSRERGQHALSTSVRTTICVIVNVGLRVNV
jgi:hypothetical protein